MQNSVDNAKTLTPSWLAPQRGKHHTTILRKKWWLAPTPCNHQETSIFYFKSHLLLYCYHIHFSTAQYKVDCAIHFSISESILDIFFSAPHLHSKFSLHAPNIYPNNQLRQFNRYPIKLIFIDFTYLNIMTLNPQFQIEFSFL